MPAQDLGSPDDYEVSPVAGNPFGMMADSPAGYPEDYDVQAVAHDPFAQPEPTPSTAGGPPLSPSDRDLLIKTVYGEARGEPPLGQAAVAHAILNRVQAGGYGQGVEGVVKAPAAGVNPKYGYHEFSPWNPRGVAEGQPAINTIDRTDPKGYARIGDIVDKAYSGLIPDPTGGATHYYGVMPHPPKWAAPLAALNSKKIGNQTFVGLAEGPGQSALPAQWAGADAPDMASGGVARRIALINRPRYQGGGDVDPLAPTASQDYVGSQDAQPAATESDPASVGQLGRPGGAGGGEGLRPAPGAPPQADAAAAEEAKAAAAAGPYKPVAGLPQNGIILPDGSPYIPGPIATAQQAAEAYMRESGLPYDPPTEYAKINRGFATRVAGAYDAMQHAPNDPAVRASYEALARETTAQWQHVKNTGLNIDWIEPGMADPYASNPRMAIKDIRDNNHWWVYPTDSGYGSTGEDIAQAENPMLRDSGETIAGRPARINDLFRVVHDYFGHAKEGHGFRAEGEENAYRAHRAMYSPEAIPAMTSELRGQNSWANFGPYGEQNRTAKAADTVFADQKIGLMPEWTWQRGAAPMSAPQVADRPPTGFFGQEEAMQRAREGLSPAGEWRGGRAGYQDGGDVDPTDGPSAGLSAEFPPQKPDEVPLAVRVASQLRRSSASAR